MNELVSHIITKAKRKGACELINQSTCLKDLYKLLLTPQGREFCQGKNFPGYGLWRLIKRHSDLRMFNIFIDEGRVNITNSHKASIIGKTDATMNCYGCNKRFFIMVQHGASLRINASDYAVIIILKIGKGNKITINKDNTVRILWEGNLG